MHPGAHRTGLGHSPLSESGRDFTLDGLVSNCFTPRIQNENYFRFETEGKLDGLANDLPVPYGDNPV